MKKTLLLVFALIISSCAPQNNISPVPPLPGQSPTPGESVAPSWAGKIPNFDHIVLIVLENRGYQKVIGSQSMPYLNSLARQNVLLTNYFAVRHPSLPNFLALVSGSTQNVTKDCKSCFFDQPTLPDLIEASGRSWKTYQEDLPSPCFVGDASPYFQKHNPFIYFDAIRLNPERCQRSIVPLTSLDADLNANQLPNFAFIMPNICNSGHDCPAETSDAWVKALVTRLQAAPALGKNSLIIITFDEGDDQDQGTCCDLGSQSGGQVATVLLSARARPGLEDGTAYSHYSLLKTILAAWSLPELANTQLPGSQPLVAPWAGQ
ncbi:MAG: hypothetical protein NTW32_14260 [Chloroflexi bacterium]|nr:hypothetical protein [Chloroflexota bacterium]